MTGACRVCYYNNTGLVITRSGSDHHQLLTSHSQSPSWLQALSARRKLFNLQKSLSNKKFTRLLTLSMKRVNSRSSLCMMLFLSVEMLMMKYLRVKSLWSELLLMMTLQVMTLWRLEAPLCTQHHHWLPATAIVSSLLTLTAMSVKCYLLNIPDLTRCSLIVQFITK